MQTIETIDFETISEFLRMDLASTDAVFSKFKQLPNAIYKEDDSDPLKCFLYIPGTRINRLCLVAHADTVWDNLYNHTPSAPEVIFEDGIFKSEVENQGIGADDRAGCAMLWLLKDFGHSLLILGSEEHGSIAAKWLMNEFPDIAHEINYEHQFVVEFDVPGAYIYKTYSVGTPEFHEYLENELNYKFQTRYTSDIDTLCDRICGTNLAVGYYDNHTENEYLYYSEWLHVLNDMRQWLSKPYFPRFER